MGIQSPHASWGNLLTGAQSYLFSRIALAVYPGGCIMVTVLSINFIGEGLREALDPKIY